MEKKDDRRVKYTKALLKKYCITAINGLRKTASRLCFPPPKKKNSR